MKTRARNSSAILLLQLAKPLALVLVFLVFGSGAASGQGWVKTYGDSTVRNSLFTAVFPVRDFMVALETQYVIGDTVQHINYVKVKSDGTIMSRKRLNDKFENLSAFYPYRCDSLGVVYFSNTSSYWDGQETYDVTTVIKINDQAEVLDTFALRASSGESTTDGSLVLVNQQQSTNKRRYFAVDDSFNVKFLFELEGGDILGAKLFLNDGFINVDQDSIQKYDMNLKLVWSKPMFRNDGGLNYIKLNQGNVYVCRWLTASYDSLWVEMYGSDGTFLNVSQYFPLPKDLSDWDLRPCNSDFVFYYALDNNQKLEHHAFVIDKDLQLKCNFLLGNFGQQFGYINQISPYLDGYVLCGVDRSGFYGQIARLNKNCNISSNLLKINLFSDDDKNCLPANNEKTLKDKLVQITNKDQLSDYFSSGADTIFAALDTGQYVIHPKAPIYYKLCVDSINISHQKYNDTISVDIPLQPEVICPYLEVDISTPFLRRCFNNTYSVRYCNQGTAIAKAAYIEVKLDKWLDYVSSTKPLSSQKGNLLRFDLGDLAVGDCGNFQIVSYLRCDSTVIEMTHCTDAHIFPDSLCLPSSGWDGSRIRVSGQCKGDSIEFEIRNASSSPMTQTSEYIVVEDEIIMMRKPFVLGANQSLRFGMPVYGRTYRVEAAQSQGHPGSSKPSVTIENCGSGPVSLGFVNQFAQDDADPFIDIDCQQSRGSFDPNDKQGFPTGYSVQKYIEPGQDIEYLIRFQNTGNDTAFTVRIHDTLSTLLDPTTIVPGASSHPYHYRLFGPGIIEFLFDPIALPDSTINKTGSIGFVKFTIAQKKDIPLGSVIYNAASIYFDYNAPIITNTTKHTIGKNFITITELKELSTTSLKVYPNPFSQEAVIELEDSDASEKTFELFDLQGRSIRREIFTNNQLIFKRNQLSSGLYFFKVTDRKGVLTQGKLVVE